MVMNTGYQLVALQEGEIKIPSSTISYGRVNQPWGGGDPCAHNPLKFNKSLFKLKRWEARVSP